MLLEHGFPRERPKCLCREMQHLVGKFWRHCAVSAGQEAGRAVHVAKKKLPKLSRRGCEDGFLASNIFQEVSQTVSNLLHDQKEEEKIPQHISFGCSSCCSNLVRRCFTTEKELACWTSDCELCQGFYPSFARSHCSTCHCLSGVFLLPGMYDLPIRIQRFFQDLQTLSVLRLGLQKSRFVRIFHECLL